MSATKMSSMQNHAHLADLASRSFKSAFTHPQCLRMPQGVLYRGAMIYVSRIWPGSVCQLIRVFSKKSFHNGPGPTSCCTTSRFPSRAASASHTNQFRKARVIVNSLHMSGVAPRESVPSTHVLPAPESSRVFTAVGIFSQALGD